jgi:hypothetical protein
MIVGPKWQGDTPAGIDKVFRSGSDFSLALFRTQLFDANDMRNVIKVQDGYSAQPLSAFLKQPAPAPEGYMPGDYGLGQISRDIGSSVNRAMANRDAVSKAFGEAFGRQQEAVETQYMDEVARAEEVGRVQALRDTEVKSYEATLVGAEKERRENLDRLQKSIADEQDALAKFEVKRDRRTDSQRALGAIAMVLSGIGGALLGQKGNLALDIIERDIDRDIEAQREQLRGKNAAVAAKQNQLGYLLSRYGDDRIAEGAIRSRMLDSYARQIQDLMQKPSSESMAANRDKLLADIQIKRAESEAKISEAAEEQVRSGKVAQAQIAEKQMGIDAQVAALLSKSKGKEVFGLTRIAGVDQTEDDVKKVKEIQAERIVISDLLQRAKEINEKAGFLGWETLNRDLVNAGETIQTQIGVSLKRLELLGAWDNGVEKLTKDMTGSSPTSGPFMSSKYDEMQRGIDFAADTRLKSHGYTVKNGIDAGKIAELVKALGGTPVK